MWSARSIIELTSCCARPNGSSTTMRSKGILEPDHMRPSSQTTELVDHPVGAPVIRVTATNQPDRQVGLGKVQ